MREVDPFDYWENHSSAIEGLGGLERSPDPRYLFHTSYHEIRTGHARFILKLDAARATYGELSVRVHAWKPGSDSNVSLVSGARMLLYGQEAADLALPVHFAPQKGVRYALYGYFSEASDVTARALRVMIEEPEDTGETCPEPPQSILAVSGYSAETGDARRAGSLLHQGRIEIANPVSQSCTADQIAARDHQARDAVGRDLAGDNDEAISRWSETLCLNALKAYGVIDRGLEGVVVGAASADLFEHLSSWSSLTSLAGPPPPRTSPAFFDFLLMPGGFEASVETPAGTHDRWELIENWLGRLKIGGLAVFCLRYLPDRDLASSSAVSAAQALSRNEIGQWAVRLIGRGYSIAPLAFAPAARLVLDSRDLAAFAMIVQRL